MDDHTIDIEFVQEYPDAVEDLKETLASYIRHGRSTPGALQESAGFTDWPG